MKILRRYLAFEILASTALVLVALLLLFAFFDLMHEMKDLGQGTYQTKQIAAFVILSMPTRLEEAAPIAALIGALYALANLIATSEYTVIRASGLSLLRLCAALLSIGLIFAVVTFAFGEIVAPPLKQLANRVRSQAIAGIVAQEFRSGLWVKDGHTFINVGQITPHAELKSIVIYDFDELYRLRKMRSARTGQYVGGSWELTDVSDTLFEGSRPVVQHLPKVTWTSALEPKLLSMLMVDPSDMSIQGLYTYTRFLNENHQNASRYESALAMKMMYPVTVLVMILLALAFARAQPRQGGSGARILTGIMLGLAFILMNRLSGTFAVLYGWPAVASAVAPTCLFLTLALAMLRRQERM